MRATFRNTIAALIVVAIAVAPNIASATEATPDVKLVALSFAGAVEARKPIDPLGGQAHPDGSRIYAFAKLANGGAPTMVGMEWKRAADQRTVRFSLRVGKSRAWRTWSYVRATEGMVGTWSVTVRDAAGKVLGARTITIEHAPGC